MTTEELQKACEKLVQELTLELFEASGHPVDFVTIARIRKCVLQELTTLFERMERENICDICGGSGIPTSRLPCMCKGTGKASVSVQAFREELYDQTLAREKAEKACAEKDAALSNFIGHFDSVDWKFLEHSGEGNIAGEFTVKDAIKARNSLTPQVSQSYIHKDELEKVQAELSAVKQVARELGDLIEYFKAQEKRGYLGFCGLGHLYNPKIEKALQHAKERGV